MSQPQYYLEAEDSAPGDITAYPIDAWPCVVGRGSDCQLQLDFDRISRRHARFEMLGNGLQVTDLDSTNGTFVNHDRIDCPTEVHDGDTIHFADHAFQLRHRDPSGQTLASPEGQRIRGGTDTVIGFTASPTGFPVQAPEMFELLNDELVCATRQIMVSGRGTVLANALRARSTHPRLGADSATLIGLSEQLGEELRLSQMMRRIALQQADKANLQTDLFLTIHPAECEEPEVLIDDLKHQCQRYRHLVTIFELPFNALRSTPRGGKLPSRLKDLGVDICACELSADDDPAEIESPIAYVCISANHDPDRVERMIGQWRDIATIVIDDLDDRGLVDRFHQAGAALFRGPAIGPEREIGS